MTLEIVGRTTNSTISRDPAWDSGRHVASITIHDQWVKRTGFYVPVDENRRLHGLDGFALRSGDVRHLALTADDGSRRWYPRADVLTEFASIGKPEYKVGLAFQTFPIGTPTSTVGTMSVWTRPNFDLSLSENWHKLKLDIALKTELARAARQFQWPFTLTGLTYKDGQLISQKDGKVVGYLSAPTAHDSSPSLMGQGKAIRITQRYVGGYIQYQLNDADMDAAVLPVTIDPTFVDGYGGDVQTYKDTFLVENNPTSNNGTDVMLEPHNYGVGDTRNVLIQMDVSSLTSVTVTTATLTMKAVGSGDTSNPQYDLSIYALLVAWVEAQATWNERSTGNNWSTGGAQGSGTDHAASATQTVSTGNGTDLVYNGLASDVQSWIDGTTTNYGWVIDPSTAPNGRYHNYGSSDNVDTAARPYLTVEYTAAGGSVAEPVRRRSLLGVGY